uniref:MFS transporter n=1 Tax=Lyngbya confervoides TaxID=207921 RepID=UPI0035C93B15
MLGNHSFLTLWGSQILSQVADKVYLVFMIALIADHYQSQGQSVSGWVSSIMIAFTVPAVVFGSIAGVMVDWWPKKRTLVLTNLLRGGLVFLLPVGLGLADNLRDWWGIPVGFWILLGMTFLVSTLTQFFAPAEQAAIPLIVEQEQLLSANSFYTLTMMAAVILGFAAGDPLLSTMAHLVTRWGGNPDLGREILVGGSYTLAGFIVSSVTVQERLVARTQSFAGVWEDIKAGLDYLGKHPQVRSAIIQLVMLFSILAALAVLVVRVAEILPELKTSQFGILLAAGGVGMALGLIFLSIAGDRYPRKILSLSGSIVLAIALAGLAFSTRSLSLTLILLIGLGSGAALVGVPMQTIIQEKTPEYMRGKIFGLQNNLVNIALSLPLALAGLAETWFGLESVFLGLTGLAVTSGFINWYISRTQASS